MGAVFARGNRFSSCCHWPTVVLYLGIGPCGLTPGQDGMSTAIVIMLVLLSNHTVKGSQIPLPVMSNLAVKVLDSLFFIALKYTLIKHITTYTAIRLLVVNGVGAVSHWDMHLYIRTCFLVGLALRWTPSTGLSFFLLASSSAIKVTPHGWTLS